MWQNSGLKKIHLYVFDQMGALDEQYVIGNLPYLPEFRAEKCRRLSNLSDKAACVMAYQLLQRGLREVYGITAPPEFGFSALGKPYLIDQPDIHFNLSHCRQGVVCAVADFEIGVDIQDVSTNDPRVVARVLPENEMMDYHNSANPGRFFRNIWAMKESYAKCYGLSVADVLQFSTPDGNYQIRDEYAYVIALSSTEPDTQVIEHIV